MADDDDLWTFDVESVTKLNPDPSESAEEVVYAIVFNANGPDVSAEIEVYVEGPPDPGMIIILAMAKLHDALAAWARITLGRRIANDEG